MPDNYENLDDAPTTRLLMLDEINGDVTDGRLYLGKRLTPAGQAAWPDLLQEAAKERDWRWLSVAVDEPSYWLPTEEYQRSGIPRIRKVNRHAATRMLAGDEFTRFYLRGVCRRAMDEERRLGVVRLREVSSPSAESEAKIGNEVPAGELLADLRRNVGLDTFLGIPRGPNSGLGVRLAA